MDRTQNLKNVQTPRPQRSSNIVIINKNEKDLVSLQLLHGPQAFFVTGLMRFRVNKYGATLRVRNPTRTLSEP